MARRTWLAIAWATLLAACVSQPIEQRDWIEVRSPNFTIFTDLERMQALALSADAELFRAVLIRMTNARLFEPRVPTRIFAFAATREFLQFSTDRNLCGFFLPGLRENLVALDASGSRGVNPREILFHEYTHFVLQNQHHVPLPLWYEEGFAEFLGATRMEGDRVLVGAAPDRQALWNNLSYREILRARDTESFNDPQTASFYVESWKIVHYLMLGPGKDLGSIGERMARYIQAVEGGAAEEAAFEASFGTSVKQLEAAVAQYHSKLRIPAKAVKRAAFEPVPAGEVLDIPTAVIGEQLGQLALALGRYEFAEELFQRALAVDPARWRALAGLGTVLLRTGHARESEVHFERALALAPDDPENQLDRGASLLQLAHESGQLDLVFTARQHYERAIALASDIPEGHLMLGSSYLLTDEDPAPGIAAAERAEELLPGHVAVQLQLAHLYARAGMHDRALAAARKVARWSHGDASEAAKRLLAELETAPAKPPAEP